MALFQSQLNTMVMWFDQWNESGQTVAVFKMLTRLAPIQAKFVSIALDFSLNECRELTLQEQAANNPGFVSGLLSESKEVAMTQLLLHLPLLRPNNQEAKQHYLAVVPMMLNYSVETGCFIEEARQLLAYVLIHPALRDDRRTFESWRRSLGEKLIHCGKHGDRVNSQQTPHQQHLQHQQQQLLQQQQLQQQQQQNKQHRRNSLTPPGITPPSEFCISQDDISVVRGKSRRFSLSDHSSGPPLSPQSQTSSGSGSETHLDDLKYPHAYESPGMKDVQVWLKSLRLHKYARLFSQMTYEQMLSLTEETFDATMEQIEAGPVTQGARRKIILSISKLRDRYKNLCQLEQDVMKGSNLLNVMDLLKAMLITPIKPAPNSDDECTNGQLQLAFDDIPIQFTKVLGKVCTQLMVCRRGDDESLSCFISLLDKTYHHEAFTSMKKKISSWRAQVVQFQQKQMQPDQPRYPPPSCMYLHPSSAPIRASIPSTRYPSCIISPTSTSPRQQHVQFHRHSISFGSTGSQSPVYTCNSNTGHTSTGLSSTHLTQHTSNPGCSSVVVGSGITNNPASVFLSKRPSLQDRPLLELSGESHANVQRTQSAPNNTETDPELNSRLESLCLQMTEQALSGASEM